MKKIIAIAVSALLLTSSIFLPEGVNAEESKESLENVSRITVVNELEYIKDLQDLSDSELLEKGASKSEIKQLREFNLESMLSERVKSLQNNSTNELMSQGYSLKQIESIQNFSGSDTQVLSLLANLSGTLSIASQGSTSTYSFVKGAYIFNWSKAPLVLIKDLIAITWSEGFYLNTDSGYTKMTYDYYNIGKETLNKTNTATVKPHLNVGVSTSFGMGYRDQEEVGIYTKKGRFNFHIDKKAKVKEMAIQSEYGHTTVAVGSPSVSIPAGLSVSFSYQVSEDDFDYKKITF
ncbi:hypothetical protein MKY27_00980 [Solibacillus sp. FSL R5-0449]|uniref:hypothetical protein n=1 Tax=Solibacillus sp. FSL R5-0449 TaxID=2921639 RepID=UPI0030D324EC